MDVLVRGKEVVHDDKVNLVAPGKFDTMEAIEAGEECMGIVLDVGMVPLEDG